MAFDYSSWELTLNEDFSSFSRYDPNTGTGRWETQYPWGRTKGEELQFYIDPTVEGPNGALGIDPFSVSGGVLSIRLDNAPSDPVIRAYLGGRPYTSGVITTHKSFSQTYGHFEVRARIPAGKGLWPAFWMMPLDGSWPPEIDILEARGSDPFKNHVSTHTGTTGTPTYQTAAIEDGSDLSAGFHLYGCTWTAETVTFWLDGEQVAQFPTPDDLHRPMYLICNLAIGTAWPGQPDGTTPIPSFLQVDYIRVYRAALNEPTEEQLRYVAPVPIYHFSSAEHRRLIAEATNRLIMDEGLPPRYEAGQAVLGALPVLDASGSAACIASWIIPHGTRSGSSFSPVVRWFGDATGSGSVAFSLIIKRAIDGGAFSETTLAAAGTYQAGIIRRTEFAAVTASGVGMAVLCEVRRAAASYSGPVTLLGVEFIHERDSRGSQTPYEKYTQE